MIQMLLDWYQKCTQSWGVSKQETIVRWDVAATVLQRIDDQMLIFDDYSHIKKEEIPMDRITLGFKLISSFFERGMSSKYVIDLEKNNLDWNTDITDMVNDINKICEILLNIPFFQTLQAWKKPIAKLLGNAIALEFLTIVWLEAVQRDAKILFDRLVYEYSTKTWRGSGDSKMANDIRNWKNRIQPVDGQAWKNFITGACSGVYNGQNTTVNLLRPVLYYYYVLTDSTPYNQVNTSFDVDHIIPQEAFKDNVMLDLNLKDSLSNLALLPKKDNISKKSKKLNEITDQWLINSVTTFAGIQKEDFDKYSNVMNITELKMEREKMFEKTFSLDRDKVLSN